MTIDRYTKAVLTVIAISLAVIALQHTIPSAFAQNNNAPVKVIICDPIAYRAECANVSYGALKVEPK
jgi:hypothetical protein